MPSLAPHQQQTSLAPTAAMHTPRPRRGQKPTSPRRRATSALPPTSDIARETAVGVSKGQAGAERRANSEPRPRRSGSAGGYEGVRLRP